MFKKPKVRIFSSLVFLIIYILLFPTPQKVYNIKAIGLNNQSEVLLYTPHYTQNAVSTGDYYEVLTTIKDIESTKEILLSVDFITVIFFGDEQNVLRQLNIFNPKVMIINGGRLYTGYSQRIQGRTVLNGEVNVQMYCKDGKIYIGTPTIYGSY